MVKEVKEYYEVNDLIPQKDGSIKIVRKKNPRFIGWGCDCGFVTMSKKAIDEHIKKHQ